MKLTILVFKGGREGELIPWFLAINIPKKKKWFLGIRNVGYINLF